MGSSDHDLMMKAKMSAFVERRKRSFIRTLTSNPRHECTNKLP